MNSGSAPRPAWGRVAGCGVMHRSIAQLGYTAETIDAVNVSQAQKLPLVGCAAQNRGEESYGTGTERRASSSQLGLHRSLWPSPPRDSCLPSHCPSPLRASRRSPSFQEVAKPLLLVSVLMQSGERVIAGPGDA